MLFFIILYRKIKFYSYGQIHYLYLIYLQKCITKRVASLLVKNNSIYFKQDAAYKVCSSIHVAWILQECIAHFTNKGKTLYLGLLDAKKAYDSVW